MNWASPLFLGLIIAIYVLTYIPAWMLLSKLVSMGIGRNRGLKSATFWLTFIAYQLVILAPYAVYFLFGQNIPTTLTAIITSILGVGILITAIRLFKPQTIAGELWWIYGFVYDGLRHFYPYRNLLTLVESALQLKSGQKVLDLGCGTGNLSEMIMKAHKIQLVASDGSSSMLTRARRKLDQIPGASYDLSRADVLDFLRKSPDKSFDRIALVNVVYAVEDRNALWEQLLRVKKVDGIIIVTNSDRNGSSSIIREHLLHDSVWKLFIPSLFLVGIIDYFISDLSKSGLFEFADQNILFAEITAAGGSPKFLTRCYGGQVEGVNILFQMS